MTDAKHTPEPWYVVPIAAGNMTVADRSSGEYVRIAQRVRKANAARIVACVNALRGLDVEKVAALLDAFRDHQAKYSEYRKNPCEETWDRAHDALAARRQAIDALADSIRAGGGE